MADADLEAKGNGDITSAPSKKFLGCNQKEWTAFLPGLGSVTLIVFGVMYMDDCPAIPTLAAYCITFGALNVLNAIIPFLFRLKKKKETGQDDAWVLLCCCVAATGVLNLGVAVWGAVITWGEVKRFGESEGCEKNLYMPGFISSALCLGIMFGIIVVRAVKGIVFCIRLMKAAGNGSLYI